ncbi:MAG: S41 family peptidase [Verrucomicrobiota bacterium]
MISPIRPLSRHLAAPLLAFAAASLSPLIAKDEAPSENDPTKPSSFVEESGFEQIELLTRVIELVRQNYVDEDKVTYEQLINSALEGMLEDLDPHSQFMHKPVFDQMKKNVGSTYDGVGITLAIKKDTITIVTVREDGPAARAGILPGDQILRINGIVADKIGIPEAFTMLRGKPGEPLTLTLRRPANKDVLEIEMVREVIERDSVKDARILAESHTGPSKIGYVRLLQFNSPTAFQLAEQLDYLEEQGIQALILDLRNNPGGLLSSAVDVCGEFIPANSLVVTTEGRPGITDVTPYYTSAKKDKQRDYPLAILINHASASGAEVVAGALQDLNRAIIVGETSFGKGSVQSILPMDAGSAMRLTTAKYFTPSKRIIHENGVTPNIIVGLTPGEEQQLSRWWRRSELDENDQEHLENFKDRQLTRAIDALKGALVYADLAKENKSPKQPARPKSPSKKKAASTAAGD